jgi:hypothetical protein
MSRETISERDLDLPPERAVRVNALNRFGAFLQTPNGRTFGALAVLLLGVVNIALGSTVFGVILIVGAVIAWARWDLLPALARRRRR